jgi:hypothetical protein
MTDIWLPGLPPAYTDWVYCYGLLQPLMPTDDDAKILAAIAGPESGYDYSVINDTPATGDYSVGLWQINYLGALYAGRSAAYGTPRQLIEGGPARQARAAADVWHSQGYDAWFNTYTSGDWKQYIGSGPIPHGSQPPGGPGGAPPPLTFDTRELDRTTRELAILVKRTVGQRTLLNRMGTPGWHP